MKQAVIAGALLLLGVTPRAQAPGALLLVLNKDEATLSIVDPRSGRTTATVPTGPNPHEVATSADGRVAVATNYGGDSLSVIEIAARREIRRVALADLRQPHGIATVGDTVVFTAEGSQAIAAYDPVANRIAWRVRTGQRGTHMIAATGDGRMLFTSNIGSNTITLLERDRGSWRPTHIPVGAGPEGLALTPDGRELWTAHSGDGGVSIIDVAARKVTRTFDLRTRRSNRLTFTRDGKFALISDLDGGELVVVDARTRAVARRVQLGAMPAGILVPPDGERAYVALTGANRAVALDVRTLNVVQTISTGRGPDGMAWAPVSPRP